MYTRSGVNLVGMQRNTLLFVLIALLAGFIGGFMLANSINRSEVAALMARATPSNTADAGKPDTNAEPSLSTDEIRAKIAEADKNPGNFGYQKELGTALYRYAAMKRDNNLLDESERILDRAYKLNGKDADVLIALGNARFDIGYAKKDQASFASARDLYTKALELKPADPDVSTDLGLTYFFQEPPAYDKAAATLQKVSDANPTHERSVEFLIQAYVKLGKTAEATKALEKLKASDPRNAAIPELTSLIASPAAANSK